MNVQMLYTMKSDGTILNVEGYHKINIKELAENLMQIIGTSSNINSINIQKNNSEHTLSDIKLAERLIRYKTVVIL